MKLDLYAERLIYREKECLYAERNGYFLYRNTLKKIVSLFAICIFSSYFLFVDASLITIIIKIRNYRIVDRTSYEMNIRPPFPPVILDCVWALLCYRRVKALYLKSLLTDV